VWVRTTTPLLIFALIALLPLVVTVHTETWVWVDEAGVTHLTDDPEAVPKDVRSGEHGRAELGELWDGPLGRSAEATGNGEAPDRAEARVQRLLRGAVADLERGENARAAAALESVLRESPGRPEPHWYLALLDRHRGRYDAAEGHLQAFLASAGDDLDPWRASAQRRLAALADERRLANEASARGATWVELASQHFRVYYDPELGRASSDYAGTVMRYLEEARQNTGVRLGAVPAERMGVMFYGRASYNRSHGHRFSFQTVGFYDGRIHVVSAAHPAGELRALLFHEYVHAIFREHTGGDRPYWLNEGLAELAERESRRQPGLTRSERSLLRARIDADEWIPLRRLAPSFSGLDDDDARVAYLEATAAAAWIEARTDRDQRARILTALGDGHRADAALDEVLGVDTDALDRNVQRWVRSEFPAPPQRDATPAHP
jgi:tetratricopeptide (TPR) repeat protein